MPIQPRPVSHYVSNHLYFHLLLSSALGCLSLSDASHIHLIILISPAFHLRVMIRPHGPCLVHMQQHILTHAVYTWPFIFGGRCEDQFPLSQVQSVLFSVSVPIPFTRYLIVSVQNIPNPMPFVQNLSVPFAQNFSVPIPFPFWN